MKKTLNATRPGEAVTLETPTNVVNPFDKKEDELEEKEKKLFGAPIPTWKDSHSPCTSMCARRRDAEYEIPCGVDCPGYKPESEVDDSPLPPKGYGELKVGMEGKLNGVPVVIRKITKKDVILRPLNRSIRDKGGLMVSFEEKKNA